MSQSSIYGVMVTDTVGNFTRERNEKQSERRDEMFQHRVIANHRSGSCL
jgi:hypothetical protein